MKSSSAKLNPKRHDSQVKSHFDSLPRGARKHMQKLRKAVRAAAPRRGGKFRIRHAGISPPWKAMRVVRCLETTQQLVPAQPSDEESSFRPSCRLQDLR
jgi:hypothetical protein